MIESSRLGLVYLRCVLSCRCNPRLVTGSIWIPMLLLKAEAGRESLPGHRQEQRAQSPLRSEQGALATEASGNG